MKHNPRQLILATAYGIFVACESFFLWLLLTRVPFLGGGGKLWPFNILLTALLSVVTAYVVCELALRLWNVSLKKRVAVVLLILTITAVISITAFHYAYYQQSLQIQQMMGG